MDSHKKNEENVGFVWRINKEKQKQQRKQKQQKKNDVFNQMKMGKIWIHVKENGR